jgi:hypothetical protein
MEDHMSTKSTSRRVALIAAVAAITAGGMTLAAPARAGNVAWSVSVGGPGFAVAAGQPGYWGGYRGYRGYGYHRPWVRPYAPVVYAAPSVYPYAYVAPRPVVVAPPPVYVAPPVPYGYGRYGWR